MKRAPTYQTWRPALQRSVVDTRFFARNSLLKNKRERQLNGRAVKRKGSVFATSQDNAEVEASFTGQPTVARP